MKKMDEMDRTIRRRAEGWGYRTAIVLLCVWMIVNLWQATFRGVDYDVRPCLILCAAFSVQFFYELAMQQQMTAGDEEYKAPNVLLRTVLGAVVVTLLVLSLVFLWP